MKNEILLEVVKVWEERGKIPEASSTSMIGELSYKEAMRKCAEDLKKLIEIFPDK